MKTPQTWEGPISASPQLREQKWDQTAASGICYTDVDCVCVHAELRTQTVCDKREPAYGRGILRDDRNVTVLESVCEHASVYVRVCEWARVLQVHPQDWGQIR